MQAKNVEEARQWIQNWRTKGPSQQAAPSSSGSDSSSSGQAPFWGGFKLPWQQQEAAAAQNGSEAGKVLSRSLRCHAGLSCQDKCSKICLVPTGRYCRRQP